MDIIDRDCFVRFSSPFRHKSQLERFQEPCPFHANTVADGERREEEGACPGDGGKRESRQSHCSPSTGGRMLRGALTRPEATRRERP